MRQRAKPGVWGTPTFATQAEERTKEGEVTEVRRKTEECDVMTGKVKQYFKWGGTGREVASGLENTNHAVPGMVLAVFPGIARSYYDGIYY